LLSKGRKNRRATLIDVAQAAGVSRATASLVIRNSPLVAGATRQRVEDAIRKLGYVRNLGAARLRADRSRIIGLIIPNLTNPFFAELLAGVEEIIDAAGMAVVLANTGDLEQRQNDVMRRMREHGVDGIIVCPASGTSPEIFESLAHWHIPAVQVLRYVTRDADYVSADYQSGMRDAVDYLASLGHHRIAFAVHGTTHSAYEERIQGFTHAMQHHGFNPEMIVHVPMLLPQISEATDALFQGAVLPTATVCFNDVIALGLSSGLYDRNIRIGIDHSIIGFDDVMEAEAIRPRLTSVSTNPTLIGRNAAMCLLDRLNHPDQAIAWLVNETVLMVRQSCGPAPV
jgi:LacI family transcriptional regulator